MSNQETLAAALEAVESHAYAKYVREPGWPEVRLNELAFMRLRPPLLRAGCLIAEDSICTTVYKKADFMEAANTYYSALSRAILHLKEHAGEVLERALAG